MNINAIAMLTNRWGTQATKDKGVVTNFGGRMEKEKCSTDAASEEKEVQELKVSVKPRRLTEKEEMLQFQQEFYAEIAKIPMSGQLNTLAIRVTDEGWKKMKENPEYREKMISLIKRDTTGTYLSSTNEIITIGRSSAEYRASSWSVRDTKKEKEERIANRRKKKKELQKMYERMKVNQRLELELLARLGMDGAEGAEGEVVIPSMQMPKGTMMFFTGNMAM